LSVPAALCGALLLAAAQAVSFSTVPAAYTDYLGSMMRTAAWIAAAAVLMVKIVERRTRQPLDTPAAVVAAFSAGALFVELSALLHPAKLPVDAVFHAHRLQAVLDGHYFFTQPMPDGVRFPYAIALYVVAAPWTALTQDHVALLRIVVSAAHAVSGALLYMMVVRTWGDRFTGAGAVVLFHLVPLPYVILGNANLTYAFGQSMAFMALAAATVWRLRLRDVAQFAGLLMLATVAFLSHVGVFPILLATLIAVAAVYRLLGGTGLRAPARVVLLAAALAAIVSVVSYYGRVGEV
jgi:hypothetical protein